MKHFMLKFNHGVEIGAILAYLGHLKRTNDFYIKIIILDECKHKADLEMILNIYNDHPNSIIDLVFTIIGNCIGFMCMYSPIFLLNFIARFMEIFAIFNYKYLAKKYPEFSDNFLEMASKEEEHRLYFRRV